jgi:sugar fermentation stimulation protein A
MKFQNPTQTGTILKRYKRFLSDIKLNSGEMITAHTANTGSMKSCWEPGWKVLVSKSPNPNRKLPYSLELTNNGESWIGVNTSLPNKIVKEAIEAGEIAELQYPNIRPEYSIGDSRIDFLLSDESEQCFVEVKNVTLKTEDGLARFPDAVSERASKHLEELIDLKLKGHRAVIFFLIQREDVDIFAPAFDFDPYYSIMLAWAHQVGVEILPYQCELNEGGIRISKRIPIEFI